MEAMIIYLLCKRDQTRCSVYIKHMRCVFFLKVLVAIYVDVGLNTIIGYWNNLAK